MQRSCPVSDHWCKMHPMRKPLLLLIIAFGTFLAGCTKPPSTSDSTIVGTWIATEYLISPGPVATWQPWKDGIYVAIFHEDGRLELTRPFLSLNYDRYEVIDATNVRLYSTSQPGSANITYKIERKKLTLWLFCIEPCGIKFERPEK